MLKRIAHVNLAVQDVEAARHFYGQVLGLEEIPRAEGPRRPGAWFRLGSLELHLSQEPDPRNAGSKRHVAFEVRELDALREHLEDAQVPLEEGSRCPACAASSPAIPRATGSSSSCAWTPARAAGDAGRSARLRGGGRLQGQAHREGGAPPRGALHFDGAA